MTIGEEDSVNTCIRLAYERGLKIGYYTRRDNWLENPKYDEYISKLDGLDRTMTDTELYLEFLAWIGV